MDLSDITNKELLRELARRKDLYDHGPESIVEYKDFNGKTVRLVKGGYFPGA